MSLDAPDSSSPSADGLRFGIVAACYNRELTDRLLTRVLDVIRTAGAPEVLEIERVPGSQEIPAALSLMMRSGRFRFDCLVALGVVVKGATAHHRLVAESAAFGLQRLAMAEDAVPVINGIVVTESEAEAHERVGEAIDRGKQFAEAAIEMATFRKRWTRNLP